MSHPLPARISDDGRTATWNPALTRAAHVWVSVQGTDGDGASARRRSLNSGRARVRETERIVAVHADEEGGQAREKGVGDA